MGADALRRFLIEREDLIDREKKDPLRFGYDPWTFKLADELWGDHSEMLIMGQNKSGKTDYAAKRAVKRLTEAPDRLVGIFEASEQAVINKQMPFLYRYLPREWRNVGKEGQTAYVKYSKQNGFSGGKFTLPNGSQCLFFNYKQDPEVFEGYAFDLLWFDELVPLSFLEGLEFRLPRGRRLEIMVTFTPVTGYTPTVGRYLADAQVVRTHPAPLLPERPRPYVKDCPPQHVPLVMQCKKEDACVVFFPWGSNPFGSNKEIADKLKGAPAAKILLRAYGWTEKGVNGAFPKFSRNAHVITRKRFEELAEKGVTRYCACDPGGGAKAWFFKWYAVTPAGHVIIYREWPSVHEWGEWAVTPGGDIKTRRWDWRPGPAQRAEAGAGITRYKQIILEQEGWRWDEAAKSWDGTHAEPIELRVMDPRMGGDPAPAADEGTSIIALMGDEAVDSEGNVTGPEIEWIPAPPGVSGSRVLDTLQMIAEKLDWNDDEPVTVLNCPKWYVVEDCEQTLTAYAEYVGPPESTEKDALKDVIDPDRYFVKTDVGFVEPGQFASRRGGCY